MLVSESELFTLAIQKVEEHRSAFERLGLVYKDHTLKEDSLTGPSVWFSFVNESNAMNVSFAISPPVGKRNGRFGTYIVTPSNRTLDVESYLRKHGLLKQAILLTYTDQVADLGSYFDTVLDTLETLFSSKLKPILEGKEWENIPFDWGPYK